VPVRTGAGDRRVSRLSRRRRALEEGVDGAEEGLLVAAGEAVDGPQPAYQAALDLGAGGRGRGQAEQLVGADTQDLGEPDDELAVQAQLASIG